MQEIYEFYKKYNQLQNVLRKGWLMRNVPAERKESDSDHTLQTILLADLIIRKYNLTDINLTKVLEMLLIHEIGETIIGDVSMIEEDYKKKKSNESQAVKEQLECLGEELSTYYYNLWLEFEQKETKEAILSYFIDKIDPVLKAKQYDEEYNTNKYFEEFYTHAKEVLQTNDFYGIIANNLNGEEYRHIKEQLIGKSCLNCSNGSCRVPTYEKIGLNEFGNPQGQDCIGWCNPELVGKAKILQKYNLK